MTSAAASDEQNSRRRFIKLLAAGATSLAVQACGGGGDGSTVPQGTVTSPIGPDASPPLSATPVWTTVPDLTFTQGVAASISVAQYVSAPYVKQFTVSLNEVALPPGVTFNATKMSFDYDGVGAAGSTDNHILTATV